MFNLSFLSRSFYYFPFTLDVLKFHCDVTWYIFIFIFFCFIIRVHFQPEWRFFDSLSILENSIITFFNIVFHSNFHLVLDFLLNIQWIISVHPPWFLTALLYFYLFVSLSYVLMNASVLFPYPLYLKMSKMSKTVISYRHYTHTPNHLFPCYLFQWLALLSVRYPDSFFSQVTYC